MGNRLIENFQVHFGRKKITHLHYLVSTRQTILTDMHQIWVQIAPNYMFQYAFSANLIGRA